jgi:GWxTD domain-containing protein
MQRKECYILIRSRHFQLFLFFLFFLSSFLLGQETEKSEKQKIEPLSEASKIWLKEVVPYIINAVEKEIFINLPTEIDRGKFIENFWRKRDPDPSTPENEFKLEYYRRIAIANKFFGSSGISGWRSDRGKIFILLGPPNEIQRDLNPTESFSTVFHGPREIWNYWDLPNPRLPYNIEFVFVDKLGTGYYVLEQSLKLGQTGQSSELDIDSMHYQFNYMENFAEAMKNPFDKLEKLRGIVETQVSYDLIPFSYDLFFLKGNERRALVPVVVEIPYSSLPQKNIEGEFYISLTLLATASNDLGQIVYERKKDINLKQPASVMDSQKNDALRLQFDLYLKPDVSRIDLLVLDNFSGKIGTSQKQISVPE